MTIEEIKTAGRKDLEARALQIKDAMTAEDADLDALTKEVDAIEARKKELDAREEQRNAIASRIKAGMGSVIESVSKAKPSANEVRSSHEYAVAYSKYIKTGDDSECRALLTANAPTNGQLPVPAVVDGTIRKAWESNTLLQHCNITALKGNVKVGFEISGTDADVHREGTNAPAEETLTIGIAEIVPQTVKKWITVSDEALALNGESLLTYLYQEIGNKIAQEVSRMVIEAVFRTPTTATATKPSRAEIKTADVKGTVADFISAKALLSDEATNLIAVMNKATEAKYKVAALTSNYPVDPFDGLTVVTDEAATSPIVGDFTKGVMVNCPDGDAVKFKYDDLSLAEKDLVKIVGSQLVGVGTVCCGCFTVIGSAE